MADKPKKTNKVQDLEQQVGELTQDLQRTRADFENYQKRADADKTMAREAGFNNAVLKLIPVIDNIERSVAHMPDELKDNAWAMGIAGLVKNLDKSLNELGIRRIEANPGIKFDPDLHDAIQFDEDAEGEHEVIAEELQSGYTFNGSPVRHAMVRVTRK